ncbi:MFS transporter [Rhodococcus sp. ACS1]|uniref:MFS transporter n=1 Tax=Rhodococcus sp. ACS1 TaxID=2028570 RepID=UPI001C52DC6D|nr:MFS transporter [Rhodococcus sp. ACS1]
MIDLSNNHSERLTPAARRAFGAAMVGTVVEWYDYALYGAASGLIISRLFFPDSVSVVGALAAFATFAVGFVVRPIGGIVLSHVGDTVGRKPAMIISIVLMGTATVAIGMLPTAEQIGIWAPILLVFFRCVQGFGAGAELAGAFTLVAEYAPAQRRGFFTGMLNATPAAGITLATMSFLLVSGMSDDVLLGWAWRIPFIGSAILFVLALYIRRRLEETPAYVEAVVKMENGNAENRTPLGELVRCSPRQLIAALLACNGLYVYVYLLNTFSLSYLTTYTSLSRTQALAAVSIAGLFMLIGSPIGGLAVDRFGAPKVLAFGGLSGIAFAYPMMLALQSGRFVLVVGAMAIANLIIIGACGGSQGSFLANLFPTRYRFSGIAVGREVSGAIVAGTVPMVATALIVVADGEVWLTSIYIAVISLLSVLAVLVARGGGKFTHVNNELSHESGDAPDRALR